MGGYYTGVGSREAPIEILTLARDLACVLHGEGWAYRSGDAGGMDQAFRQGAQLSPILDACEPESYVPWDHFDPRDGHPVTVIGQTRWAILAPQLPHWDQATAMAEALIPHWGKLTRGMRMLHTRNMFQPLGPRLDNPSKRMICWAKPNAARTAVAGGTNSAYQLCLQHHIPILNLYEAEAQDRVHTFLTTARIVQRPRS